MKKLLEKIDLFTANHAEAIVFIGFMCSLATLVIFIAFKLL